MKFFCIFSLIILISACAVGPPRAPAIPANAPTAELNDRFQTDDDDSNPRLFVIIAIDGHPVQNAITNTRRVGAGIGPGASVPYLVARTVEAKASRYTVRGQYAIGAPIIEIIRRAKDNWQVVEGDIAFDPKPGMVYRLNGELSRNGSSIWIEEFETGKVVSERLSSNK